MTTGSWTVGYDSSIAFGAKKSWSGDDGKTEPYAGGIRSKWNNYTLRHGKYRRNGYPHGWPSDVGPILERQIDGPGGIRETVGWTANDDLRVLNKLAELVKGHSFDLGINLAEAGKTYGTIVSNLQSVGSALLALKKGNLAGALRSLGSGRSPGARAGGVNLTQLRAKDLTGRWLETQYAFMPLISQSYEAGRALKALTGPRVLRFSASVSTKRKVVDESSSPANYKKKVHWTYNRRILAELSEALSAERSLGLTNPAAIAWEVVPYSFVVDWFIPVGTYLSAWGVIPKLQGRFLTIERGGAKHGPEGVEKSTTPWDNFNQLADYKTTGRREEFFRLRRTVSTSLSVPWPTFNHIPSALSPRRLLSAVSLIHQRLA